VAVRRAAMFWSGGKDSAMALHRARNSGDWQVECLITTINPEFGRVSMHGVREALIEAQAQAAGLPLRRMYVPTAATGEAYEAALRETLIREKAAGVEAVIFGDIFLADLRAWREAQLAEFGLEGVFPLWGADTRALAAEFVAEGFQAVICCAGDAWLDETAVGRPLDAAFVDALPPGADPCGENGEYHSFVHAGPVFAAAVPFAAGERVYRPLSPAGAPALQADADEPQIGVPAALPGAAVRGFWFMDLLPGA